MRGVRILATALTTLAVLALPFLGGAGPGIGSAASAHPVSFVRGHPCPSAIAGNVSDTAPDEYTASGVGSTTQRDLTDFAVAVNSIRVDNCLEPIPWENFTWDGCMQDRLYWMAEDPSDDPLSAWGHTGSTRSDGVPSVGCDGNLAGGTANTGSTVAHKWWDSPAHRASLFRPGTSVDGACIAFAMSHGGIPNEPYPFTRAAARWYDC